MYTSTHQQIQILALCPFLSDDNNVKKIMLKKIIIEKNDSIAITN